MTEIRVLSCNHLSFVCQPPSTLPPFPACWPRLRQPFVIASHPIDEAAGGKYEWEGDEGEVTFGV